MQETFVKGNQTQATLFVFRGYILCEHTQWSLKIILKDGGELIHLTFIPFQKLITLHTSFLWKYFHKNILRFKHLSSVCFAELLYLILLYFICSGSGSNTALSYTSWLSGHRSVLEFSLIMLPSYKIWIQMLSSLNRCIFIILSLTKSNYEKMPHIRDQCISFVAVSSSACGNYSDFRYGSSCARYPQ